MEQFAFRIKVSDILLSPGKEETMKLENKKTTQIKNLHESWVNWDVLIRWLDEKTVLVELNITAYLDEICEVSGNDYVQEIKVESYQSKFSLPEENIIDLIQEGDMWEISERDKTIDIEEMVVNSILLNKPTVNKSPEIIERDKNNPVEDYDSYLERTQSNNTITWVFKDKE